MARSHCTELGPGQGPGKNGFVYIIQNCSYCTRTWNGTRPIVSYCASPIPCPCPGPGSVQCERAIRGINRFPAQYTVEIHFLLENL